MSIESNLITTRFFLMSNVNNKLCHMPPIKYTGQIKKNGHVMATYMR